MIFRTLLACAFFLLTIPVAAQDGVLSDDSLLAGEVRESFAIAEIVHIQLGEKEDIADTTRIAQNVTVRLLSGPHEGEELSLTSYILNDRDDMRFQVGERVVMETLVTYTGQTQHFIREKYRLPSLVWLCIGFFFLAVLLGGRKGATSVLGLVLSICILAFYVVPQIVSGSNPLLTSLIGAAGIALSSLYLAHGFGRRTSIALLSTLLTLGLATILAILAVKAAKIFGMGTEETVFLQLGPLHQVNLQGLLLGGMVIGALGILDDITTAQTAAIDELKKANPRLSKRELRTAGLSIGGEHIASLINSLALAYAGASLPLLLLFTMNRTMPWWVVFNSEFLAEEIVRTLVGSAALLLAVPISTVLATEAFHRRPSRGGSGTHRHFHAH